MSTSGIPPLKNSPVRPNPHCAKTHVQIREADGAQTGPGELLVIAVQRTHAVVELVSGGMFRDTVESSTNQVAEGVASEHIGAKKDGIDRQDEAADADAEAVREPE